MKKRTDAKPSAAPMAIVEGKPLLDRSEQERSNASYREYTLTECERLAYIAKYGAPSRPYRAHDGKEVIHRQKARKNA